VGKCPSCAPHFRFWLPYRICISGVGRAGVALPRAVLPGIRCRILHVASTSPQLSCGVTFLGKEQRLQGIKGKRVQREPIPSLQLLIIMPHADLGAGRVVFETVVYAFGQTGHCSVIPLDGRHALAPIATTSGRLDEKHVSEWWGGRACCSSTRGFIL